MPNGTCETIKRHGIMEAPHPHHSFLIGTMLLSAGAMLDWSPWVRGLLSSVIGGGAGAVAGAVGVPAASAISGHALDLREYFWTVIVIFLTSAGIHFFAFLAQKPLPDLKTTTTDTTIEVHGVTGSAAAHEIKTVTEVQDKT